jgi:hypothetical protein
VDLVRWPQMQALLGPRRGSAPRNARNRKVYPILALPDGRIIDGHQRWIAVTSMTRLQIRVLANVSDADALLIGQAINLSRARDEAGVVRQIAELRTSKGNHSIAPRLLAEMAHQGWSHINIATHLKLNVSNANRVINGTVAAEAYPITLALTGDEKIALPNGRRAREWFTVANAVSEMAKRANEIGAAELASTWTQAERDRILAINRATAERLTRFCDSIQQAVAVTGNGVHHEPIPEFVRGEP